MLQWVAIILAAALLGSILAASKGDNPTPLSEEMEPTKTMALLLNSSAFSYNGKIPAKHTCDGEDTSPPLAISGVPAGAKSLALSMHDPDAPVASGWTHWVVFNIPPDTRVIEEGKEPSGVSGKNSWGRAGYGGPCPPSGTHRYFFTLYALDALLSLPEGSGKKEVEQALKGHILEQAELVGLYQRKNR